MATIIPDGKELVQYLRDRGSDPSLRYFRFGSGIPNRVGTSMDFIAFNAKLVEVYPAAWLFSKLLLERDSANHVELSKKDMSEAEYAKVKIGFKWLNAEDAVRRGKRGHYMINPALALPTGSLKDAMVTWDSLKK